MMKKEQKKIFINDEGLFKAYNGDFDVYLSETIETHLIEPLNKEELIDFFVSEFIDNNCEETKDYIRILENLGYDLNNIKSYDYECFF